MKVKSTYAKYVQMPSRGRIIGREAAQAVMESAGIYDVEICLLYTSPSPRDA